MTTWFCRATLASCAIRHAYFSSACASSRCPCKVLREWRVSMKTAAAVTSNPVAEHARPAVLVQVRLHLLSALPPLNKQSVVSSGDRFSPLAGTFRPASNAHPRGLSGNRRNRHGTAACCTMARLLPSGELAGCAMPWAAHMRGACPSSMREAPRCMGTWRICCFVCPARLPRRVLSLQKRNPEGKWLTSTSQQRQPRLH